MEVKKSLRADLEGGRTTRLLVGLVVALALLYAALEWSVPVSRKELANDIPAEEEAVFEEVLPPVAELPADPVPPPLPEETAPAAEVVEVVSDEEETEAFDVQIRDPQETDTEQAANANAAHSVHAGIQAPDSAYFILDRLPSFPGGESALIRYLAQHLRYPPIAQTLRRQGCVQVQFIVEADGRVDDVQVVRSVNAHLDREALRVVKAMPRWAPGLKDGCPIRVRYTLPIVFRLN